MKLSSEPEAGKSDRTASTFDPLETRPPQPHLFIAERNSSRLLLIQRGKRVLIGRDSEANIQLNDTAASRHHAEVIWDDKGVFVKDLGSRHGTAVNGYRITESYPLIPRDTIYIGHARLTFDASLPAPIPPLRRELLSAFAEGRTLLIRTHPLIVSDPQMLNIYEQIMNVALGGATVLIDGETGVGKEIAAAAVHAWSARSRGPFICISCAAQAEGTLDSELFGHEKGAFTHASQKRLGAFERAAWGTIFLDEVAHLSAQAQAKLLRVLETHEILPVGGVKERHLDIRVVAATSRDLSQQVKAGRFLEDLLHRLNTMTITIPPLRERPVEIPFLARHFLNQFCASVKRNPPVLSNETLDRLKSYSWPGNVRELRNLMEWVSLQVKASSVEPGHLSARLGEKAPTSVVQSQVAGPASSLDEAVRRGERDALLRALQESGGCITRAAEILDVSRSTVYRLMGQYGLSRAEKASH